MWYVIALIALGIALMATLIMAIQGPLGIIAFAVVFVIYAIWMYKLDKEHKEWMKNG